MISRACGNPDKTTGLCQKSQIIFWKTICQNIKLEDLKVLRRSSDLLNNVKIGQG